jgi:RNA polymerase sigma-70 factor (ECF subfamily)
MTRTQAATETAVVVDADVFDVQRVLAGDLSAFSGIVSRWQGRLVNLAWRFCRDRSMAEDMAQDAFVKAFKALRTFRGDSAFSTWLTAVAMNSYRSALRDREPVAVPLDPVRVAARDPDAPSAMLARERADAVRQAVLTLPPRYREPLVLFYFHEMDLAETARVLRLPDGTVKARLHRGRQLLKRRAGTWWRRFDDPERGD